MYFPSMYNLNIGLTEILVFNIACETSNNAHTMCISFLNKPDLVMQ